MRSFFSTALRWIQWTVGMVPPSARRSAVLFRIIHYTVVVVVTVLLAFFTDRIDQFLGWNDLQFPDWFPRAAQKFWWGCLFLLSYVFVRLVVYLITLLRIQDETEFADIWEAWNDGLRGLDDQRLDIRWLPVFLVNGLTRAEEGQFFQMLRLNWRTVAPAPGQQAAPLRFFANEELILISCTNVGATSAQLTNYEPGMTAPGNILQRFAAEREGPTGGTLSPMRPQSRNPPTQPPDSGGTLRSVSTAGEEDRPPAEEHAGGTLRSTVRWSVERAMAFGGTLRPGALRPAAPTAARTGRPVPLPQKKLDWHQRRMRFLCELIANERKPWSPINGMLQVAPISWSETSPEAVRVAAELSKAVATDLETAHRTFELRFPVTLMLTGIDGFEGFKEFIDRCAKREPQFRDSRAGSRFPLGRPLENTSVGWVVVRLLDWLKGWIYKVFADDLDHASNRKLYYLLCSLRTRQNVLETQVERSLSIGSPSAAEASVLVSGIYFSAVGDGGGRPAFGRGLLQKLIEEQDALAWTTASVRRDRNFRRASFVLFTLAAVLLGLIGWQLFEIYRGDFAQPKQIVQETRA